MSTDKNFGKRVHKTRRFSIYRVEEYEQYLTDMSKKGYHFHKMSAMSDCFKKGAELDLVYRIVYAKKAEKEEVIKQYGEKEFTHITSRKGFHFFVSRDIPSTEEQENDTALWNVLKKHSTRNMVLLIILAILLLVITGCLVFVGKTPCMNLLDGGISYLSMLVIVVMLMIMVVRQGKRRKEMCRRLKEKTEFNHHAGYDKLCRNFRTFVIVTILLCCINFIVAGYSIKYIYDFYNGKVQYNLTLEKELPVSTPRLNDIEKFENVQMMTVGDDAKLDEFNNIRTRNNLLYKESEIKETLIYAPEDSEAMKMSYMITHYYKSKLPLISKGVFREELQSVEEYYNTYGETSKETIKSEKFDEVVKVTADILTEYTLVVRKGNTLASYRYQGTKEKQEVLDVIASELK